ncbi:MAG TPA: serine/threonine-protein kinase [Polyangiaceae bacterium]|nr:serine/threonine-protein kinase [Polyangiaceae bacterium]
MKHDGAPGSGSNGGWGAGEADPLLGRVLGGRFVVRSPLARGSMGRVYVAEQLPLGRVCALKVLAPRSRSEPASVFAKRFFLEASVVARLKHPNTVTVFDFGDCDGVCYLAMELLEGRTLRRAINDGAPFAEARAAHIGRQIARSLREAHGSGVVHRDLKPANVFLVEQDDEPDFVKVLDFGLAKPIEGEGEDLTTSHRLLGSPRYMAPEQIQGARVDERTDVYALGVVLYEMAAGRPPFQGATPIQTMTAHLTARPPRLEGASDAFGAIVARALAKDPARRFPSMFEMLEALAPLGPAGARSDAPAARTPEGGTARARLGASSRPAREASSASGPSAPRLVPAEVPSTLSAHGALFAPAPAPASVAPAAAPASVAPAVAPASAPMPAAAPLAWAPIPASVAPPAWGPAPAALAARALAPAPASVVAPAAASTPASVAPASIAPLVSSSTPASTPALTFARPTGLSSPPPFERRESVPSVMPSFASAPPPAPPRAGRWRVLAPVRASLATALALVGGLLYVQARSLRPQPHLVMTSLATPAARAGASPPGAPSPAARAGASPPGAPPPAEAAARPATEAAAPGAAVTDVTDKMLHLETEPPGASVRLGSLGGPELCPSTPCQVDLGSDDGGALLYFVREGSAPAARRAGAGARVVVRLTSPRRLPAQADRGQAPD